MKPVFQPKPMSGALVVLMVTLLTAVQPIATDLYLSALPAIRREYGAPVGVVQLTLSLVVFSFGLSQLFWGPAADRFTVLAGMTMVIPIFGALLATYFGWRATLLAMALFGAATLLLVLLRVPETVPQLSPDAMRIGPLFRGYGIVIRHRGFQAWTLLNSAGYAANFGFYSSSAYLFIDTFGVSRVAFGGVIGGASFTYMIGTILCRRWMKRIGILHSVRRAGVLSLVAAALFIVPQLFAEHTAVTLALALWTSLLAYGVHQPCGHVGIAASFPERAGAASALGGFVLAVAAFLCGTWLGYMFQSGSAAVLSLTIGVLVGAVGLFALTLVQRHGEPSIAPPAPTSPVPELSSRGTS
ncbi:MAG: MFS transporter [Variovorax sp.]|nr:MAG: MFS transporter [Variovorax sp.]